MRPRGSFCCKVATNIALLVALLFFHASRLSLSSSATLSDLALPGVPHHQISSREKKTRCYYQKSRELLPPNAVLPTDQRIAYQRRMHNALWPLLLATYAPLPIFLARWHSSRMTAPSNVSPPHQSTIWFSLACSTVPVPTRSEVSSEYL